MKTTKLYDMPLTATTVETSAANFLNVQPASNELFNTAIATITVEDVPIVISAQTGDFMPANKLSVMKYDDYQNISASVSADGRFYFTYQIED